jgi:hypothetical protein
VEVEEQEILVLLQEFQEVQVEVDLLNNYQVEQEHQVKVIQVEQDHQELGLQVVVELQQQVEILLLERADQEDLEVQTQLQIHQYFMLEVEEQEKELEEMVVEEMDHQEQVHLEQLTQAVEEEEVELEVEMVVMEVQV